MVNCLKATKMLDKNNNQWKQALHYASNNLKG